MDQTEDDETGHDGRRDQARDDGRRTPGEDMLEVIRALVSAANDGPPQRSQE